MLIVCLLDKTQEEIKGNKNNDDDMYVYTGISLHKPSARGRSTSSSSPTSVVAVSPSSLPTPVWKKNGSTYPASPIKRPALAIATSPPPQTLPQQTEEDKMLPSMVIKPVPIKPNTQGISYQGMSYKSMVPSVSDDSSDSDNDNDNLNVQTKLPLKLPLENNGSKNTLTKSVPLQKHLSSRG